MKSLERQRDPCHGFAPAQGLGPDEILKILPHRPPLVSVDRVIEVQPGRRILAQKLVGGGEPLWKDAPRQPEVLLIEVVAQAGRLVASIGTDAAGRAGYLARVKDFHWTRSLTRGEILSLEVKVVSRRSGFIHLHGQVWGKDELVAKGELILSMPREKK